MHYMTLFACVFSVLVASVADAQNRNGRRDQALADAYSTCLRGAVQAERRKRTPSIDDIKSVCAREIAAFHASLPDFARGTVIEQLDEKLAEELR